MTVRGRRIVKMLIKGYRNLIKGKEIPPIPVKPLEIRIKGGVAGEKEEKTEGVKVEGLEVPAYPRRVRIGEIKTEEERVKKTLTYSLIPAKPARDDPVFAYVRIFWDAETGKYIYQLVEPKLPKELENILVRIRELLEQRLDVDFTRLKKFEAKEYLDRQVDELIKYFGFKMTHEENLILHYYVERDFIGLGKIEAIMRDPQIEDISCDGVGIPLYVFHRDPEIGSIVTNIVFPDPDKLDSFLVRLSQVSGKSISVGSPLVDATLPDGSRLQATLATDIARRGSNFTIRKFSKEPLTPIHILDYGTIDIRTLAYLWFIVDIGRSMLVCGGTATGKTSFLNVLSLFIRPEKKIVSIEDTAEIQLPHPHWVPTVARTSIAAISGREVDLFALLKESMRQRPDYIIVGEVRGNEAYILFQQIATGHPSLATIHAENMPKLMDRLTTQPISLPPTLVGSLDLIVFLTGMKYKGRFVRRVNEVLEMVKFDQKTNEPVINTLFKWNPITDKFDVVGKSVLLKKISDATGLPEKEINDELKRRMIVLNWMDEQRILNYKDVYRIITRYYTNPKEVLDAIMR